MRTEMQEKENVWLILAPFGIDFFGVPLPVFSTVVFAGTLLAGSVFSHTCVLRRGIIGPGYLLGGSLIFLSWFLGRRVI